MEFSSSLNTQEASPVFGPGQNIVIPGSSNIFETINIPTTTRTLVITGVCSLAASNIAGVAVTGIQTNIAYRTSTPLTPPYLFGSAGLSFQCIVPVIGTFDSSVLLSIENNNASPITVALTVMADNFQYDESMLYNGIMQSTANSLVAAGSVTILNGPARILEINGFGVNTPNASIQLSGQVITFLPNTLSGASAVVEVPIPPNTILAAGKAIILVQGGAAGNSSGCAVTYAYP